MKTENVRIDEPCSASWDEMHGDGQKRFCDHCTKDVHHLSAMTRQDARSLLRKRGDDGLCVRYAFDATGRLRFSNRRVQPSAPMHQRIGAAALLATASMAASMIAACDWTGEANGMPVEHKGEVDDETTVTGEPEIIEPVWMGEMVPPDDPEGSGETDGSGDEVGEPCDPDSPAPLDVEPQLVPRLGRIAPDTDFDVPEELFLEEMGDAVIDPEAVFEQSDTEGDVEIETVTLPTHPSDTAYMIAGGLRPMPSPDIDQDVDPAATLEAQEDRAADRLAEFGISLDDEEIVDEECGDCDEGSGSAQPDASPTERIRPRMGAVPHTRGGTH